MEQANKELQKAIYTTKLPVDNKADAVVVKKYDRDGKDTKLDADACASMFKRGQKQVFKLKSKRGGHLYNPNQEGIQYGLKLSDKTTGMPMFQWKEVSEKAFNFYVQFLGNKQESLFTLAERNLL